MASIHPDQIKAAEAVLKPYIPDDKISVAALFLEAYGAFVDAGQRKVRTGLRRGLTKLPSDCPDLHGRDIAKTYWAKIGRHDLVARIDDIIEGFRAHHMASGTTMESWPSAWVTWYRNAVKFEKLQGELRLVGAAGGYEPASLEGWVTRLAMFTGRDGSPKGTWREKAWGPVPTDSACKCPQIAKDLYRERYGKKTG